MNTSSPAEKEIWTALKAIPDPEMPVVSLVEMGIVRQVAVAGRSVKITITPTFSGCPALEAMQEEIHNTLVEIGYAQPEIVVALSPPWSSNWIQPSARDKLRAFGIAPPAPHQGNIPLVLLEPIACPYCSSEKTTLQNSFGSTPCRMIFTCRACRQPFEAFKPL